MSDSFQNEVPKARINLKLDLHTGGASKKMELPLKLLVAGDFSNGQDAAPISEREKVNITKNNFDSVLSEYSPKVNLSVKNTLSDDGGEDNIELTFQSMKDFTPEQVAAQITCSHWKLTRSPLPGLKVSTCCAPNVCRTDTPRFIRWIR
ncbi:type VI secretion system contractile sheath small subunit [Enterobacter kobei]|uniref:type VI secretion system contractile sheath small subunit n=1 Tax=Enterobacter kobei TaxID=208224 RepID=UPI0020221A37|nr:type VI secretion system contractile sheath small subunit [Enterobacter kobei]URE93991.1 type VI secretion system contractile sheath small subunit [Enterobacter kobei]